MAVVLSTGLILTGCKTVAGGSSRGSEFTIKFDESKVSCKKWVSNGEWSAVSNSEKVKEGDKLLFEAIALSEDEIVDEWKIGPSTQIGYIYTVKKSDADGGLIKISCTTKLAEKFKVIFDSTVQCKKWILNGSFPAINSGDKVKEGDKLFFGAKDLASEKCVNKWQIGGKLTSRTQNIIHQKISKKLADSSGNINISYTTRAAEEITIEFDSTIKCRSWSPFVGESPLSSGNKVREGVYIECATTDKKEVRWFINGNKYNFRKRFYFYVGKEKADADKKMKISYKE